MKPRVLLLCVVCLLVTGILFAQTKKPLTNDDIVQMARAGFDEATIIKAIQANETNFDTSVDTLIALKGAGISEPIIGAMLQAQASGKATVSAKVEEASEPVPGLPKTPGAYYQSAAGWMRLQDAPRPQSKSSGLFGAATGVGTMRVYYVYRGAHAPTQFTTPMPIFYVRGLGKFGRDVQIIRLETKKDSRAVQFASASALRGSTSSIDDKNIQIPTVSRLGSDVLMVTPAAALAVGEYLLSVDADHEYDFGIAPDVSSEEKRP
jgi:hypothetical protein